MAKRNQGACFILPGVVECFSMRQLTRLLLDVRLCIAKCVTRSFPERSQQSVADSFSFLAKTVDHISNGRLILGIGAGWNQRDYREYGYDFGTAGSRLKALEEALPIILHRWQVDVPKPVQQPIPILIGGGGEKKTLRIAARYANIWHGFGDPATMAHKGQVLDQWCAEIGRNPREIERSTEPSKDDSDKTLDEYVRAGVTHFIYGTSTPWDFETLQRLVRWRDKRNGGH